MNNYKTTKIEIVLIMILVLAATGYLLSGALAGLNGHHTWRQADVYSHILGFMGYKNFNIFDSFILGKRAVFDIPIYEWMIAKISLISHLDPLVVTNVLNYFFWIVTALCGYKISNIIGDRYAGLSFLFLFALSPLILHYYSVPLPDTMAIAFSAVAITILLRNKVDYRNIFMALPFVAIATLIKSPIVFIFMAFYLSYIFLVKEISFSSVMKISIKKILPLLILLVATAAFAVMAELLRKYLLGTLNGLSFAQDSSWYFGTWDLRTSKNFWNTIIERTNLAGPYLFSYVYIAIIGMALLLKRDKILLAVTLSTLLVFFLGWLTFSNLYWQHDYYELPISIILFYSCAISMSYIIKYLSLKYFNNMTYREQVLSLVLIFTIVLHLVSTQTYISGRERTTVFSTAEHLMKKLNIFLYITDHFDGNPSIGGYLSTKFSVIGSSEFEHNCKDNLMKYEAILGTYNSPCLHKNKQISKFFLQNKDTNIYIANPLERKLLQISKRKPDVEDNWDIYINKDSITFYKASCSKADKDHIFFFRLLPNNREGSTKDDDFINLDFRFDGLDRDDICLVDKKLPDFKIVQIRTGQYGATLDKDSQPKYTDYWKRVINIE